MLEAIVMLPMKSLEPTAVTKDGTVKTSKNTWPNDPIASAATTEQGATWPVQSDAAVATMLPFTSSSFSTTLAVVVLLGFRNEMPMVLPGDCSSTRIGISGMGAWSLKPIVVVTLPPAWSFGSKNRLL